MKTDAWGPSGSSILSSDFLHRRSDLLTGLTSELSGHESVEQLANLKNSSCLCLCVCSEEASMSLSPCGLAHRQVCLLITGFNSNFQVMSPPTHNQDLSAS